MTLKEFIEFKKIKIADVSAELGFPYQTIVRWINGARFPRPENMMKIVKWSKGVVGAEDFYNRKFRESEIKKKSNAICRFNLS